MIGLLKHLLREVCELSLFVVYYAVVGFALYQLAYLSGVGSQTASFFSICGPWALIILAVTFGPPLHQWWTERDSQS